MTSMDEQETTVSAGRTDGNVQIYTTNSVHLKKLRARADVTEQAGDETYGFFLVPSAIFDPLTGFHRAPVARTPEESEKLKERMRKAREAKIGKPQGE